MNDVHIVVVTGLSGSGRSAALKSFEDLGYTCIDNLPLSLLPAFVEYAMTSGSVILSAIGIDIRERDFPRQFPGLYGKLKEAGVAIELLFLEASDQTIVRRFSETRRPHPLARGGVTLVEAIRTEREALAAVRTLADQILDTTDYTVHDLRQAVERRYSGPGGSRPLMVTIVTFGYKYGIPYELDLLFDVRFLPNPHFAEELRPLTGRDQRVRDFVLSKQDSGEFIERLVDFLAYLLPRYRSEGKSYLNVGFGCTGGRHRSVAISLVVAERLVKLGFDVNLKHRDAGD